MQQREIKLDTMRSASATVLLPIAGLLGGLIIGGFRGATSGLSDPFRQLSCAIAWGVTGFFAGLGLVLLLAVQFPRSGAISIRRLMFLVLVAAIVAWFFARVLFGVIGTATF